MKSRPRRSLRQSTARRISQLRPGRSRQAPAGEPRASGAISILRSTPLGSPQPVDGPGREADALRLTGEFQAQKKVFYARFKPGWMNSPLDTGEQAHDTESQIRELVTESSISQRLYVRDAYQNVSGETSHLSS